MTVHYPDVSSYQAGLSLAGAPAAMAKATEGTWYHDPTYAGFKAQMAGPFSGYHYLRDGDASGQAAYAHAVVGATPLMLDVELGGSDGSWPSLDEMYAFIDFYRTGGGVLTTAYIPHWFWQGYWGSPSLAGLTQRGVGLISSNYTVYSDTGPGWVPYGGVTPTIWQYSSTYPFNGYRVDMNAFKGTVEELWALFNGTPSQRRLDMPGLFQIKGDQTLYLSDGFYRKALTAAMWADFKETWGDVPIAIVENATALEAIAGPDWTTATTPPTGGGVSADEVRAIVREELDKTKLAG